MAFRPNLVNKQFNSPIKLYSPENVADALEKQKQILANGAVGIDFHNLAKPGNLANSAVLRMLEEEEANRGRSAERMNIIAKDLYHPWIERFLQHAMYHNDEHELMIKTFWSKLKKWSVHPPNRRVKWPPSVMQKNGKIRPAFFPRKLASAFLQSGVKRVAWPPPPEDSLEEEVHSQQFQQYQQPVYSQGLQSVQKPVSPVKSVKPPSPSPQLGGYGGRRPEEPPLLAHTYSSTQGILPTSPPAGVQSVPYHPVHFEPPKTTVTLLPTAPVRQKPAPVYVSQPVTATVKGGTRMRGDQKWPPESVKQQTAAENEARVALAKGPACRPRKVKKDYSTFFAQHALTATYPGYRAPPGTQHYMEGASNL